MRDTTDLKISLRTLCIEDYLNLKDSMAQAYSSMGGSTWSEEAIQRLLQKFPDGQIGILVNDKVVGCALSLIIDFNTYGAQHTYAQITGNYTFDTHDFNGDVLYGIELFVHPEYRGLRLARRLYDARKELCENLNLKAIIAGGRIPGYQTYAKQLTPKQYIDKVKAKEIYDPVLSFQLANDFHIKKVMKGYLSGDQESLEYATLIEWLNIYYEPRQSLINQQKSIVRLGLVQWQMRPHRDLSSLIEQIEFFVDAVSDYNSDFILFPELFNAPLMAEYNDLGAAQAIRGLAGYTPEILTKFKEFAVSYNINIITGSMPMLEGKLLYNVSYLCRRDGSYEEYRKIHITPSERDAWGMVGGSKLETFDTDCGRIGIVICYDVEFPELSRLLADQQMDILFVPFLTDTQNGYIRVRHCAQARAIENECYVAIAGCVGNLPRVNNMDIQYAQSAIFTPSDFPFPTNGVKAETTPNTEMTIIADVDLDKLKELHSYGSVRILKDRRKDLYEIKFNGKKD